MRRRVFSLAVGCALACGCDTTRFETRRGNVVDPPGTCPSASCKELVSTSGGACVSGATDAAAWTRVGATGAREDTLVVPGATAPAQNFAFHGFTPGARWTFSFAVRVRIVGDPGFRCSLAKLASSDGSLQLFYTPAASRLQVCLSSGSCRDVPFPFPDLRTARLVTLTADRVDRDGAVGVAVSVDCEAPLALGDLTGSGVGAALVSRDLRAILGNDESQSQELEVAEAVFFHRDLP